MATMAISGHRTHPPLAAAPAVTTSRAPGRRVRADLAVALTSRELLAATRSRQLEPGGCIAVSPTGTTLALGDKAREMEGRVPPHLRVLQPLQGGRVRDAQLAARVLQHAFRQAGFTGPVGPRLLLQIPGSLTDSERCSLREAARSAGARSVELVEQCLVAAVGAGLPVLEARASLVIHLDWGSAEAALISYGRVLARRSLPASTQQWQQALCDLIRRDFQVQLSLDTANQLLFALGNAFQKQADEVLAVGGRDLAKGLPRLMEIGSATVHAALHPSLLSLARELKSLVAEASTELLGDLVEHGVTLTGPGAQLAGLDSYLSAEVGLLVTRQPEDAGLTRMVSESPLRRALLGATLRRRNWRPARLAAAAVLFLGLGGVLLNLLTSPRLDTAFQNGLAPFFKAANATSISTTRPDPVRAEERRRQQQLLAENNRLRALVKLPAAPYSRGGVKSARVIAREPQGWPGMLTLDAGSNQGVRVGMPVVDSAGMVGTISTVSRSSARVRSLNHPNTVVAARVGSANGVFYGRNQPSGELRFLDPDAKIKVGDKVFTSGLDGRYPAGLAMGKVVRFTPQRAAYSSAWVQPAGPVRGPEVLLLQR